MTNRRARTSGSCLECGNTRCHNNFNTLCRRCHFTFCSPRIDQFISKSCHGKNARITRAHHRHITARTCKFQSMSHPFFFCTKRETMLFLVGFQILNEIEIKIIPHPISRRLKKVDCFSRAPFLIPRPKANKEHPTACLSFLQGRAITKFCNRSCCVG